eukprot:1140610-Pelagomonas_calceolata.AAC.2
MLMPFRSQPSRETQWRPLELCRSGPGSGAVEKEFRGGVSQHGSAYPHARLPISVGSHRQEGGPCWDVGEHA